MSTDKRAVLVLAAVAWLAGPLAGAAGQRMVAEEMVKAFTGITLDGVYFDGGFYTEAYREDGTIRYWDARGADSGRWSVRDGLFCTFYQHQDGACFLVERDGDNCFTFFEMEEDDPTVPKRNWTSRGWNRAAASTCPTAPEVAI